MTNKVTEAAYKAQIATLQAQLMQRHTVTAIDAVQPFCEAIGINPADYVKAVSYTHLDVYKRQDVPRYKAAPPQRRRG